MCHIPNLPLKSFGLTAKKHYYGQLHCENVETSLNSSIRVMLIDPIEVHLQV